MIINFIVAYATASRTEWRQFIKGPDHWGGWADIIDDDAMPLFVAAVVTLAFGAGKVSIDYLLAKTVFRSSGATPPEPPAVAQVDSSNQRQFQ